MPIILKAISLILILYGLSIARLQTGSSFFLFWLALGSAGFILSELIRKGITDRIPLHIRHGLIGLIGLGGALYLLLLILILSASHEMADDHPDYLIVLGAQVREKGPSRVLTYRLDAAADYLKEHPKTILILSGGQGKNEPWPEAEGMRKYLTEHGLPKESRVIIEKESMTTRENLQNSFRLTGDVPVAIVTNNFHLYRAKMLARQAGYREVSGIAAESTPYYLPNNLTREVLALIKDFIRGLS